MQTIKDILPEEKANDLRNALWDKQILPIDPVAISLKLGIKAVQMALPENVSGAIIKEQGKDAVIVVDRNDSNNRKRFTVAHELGHYIYRVFSNENNEEFEWIDFRGEHSKTGEIKEEIFANNFAANLLMPSDMVKKYYSETKNVLLLANKFGVSIESMIIRLKNVGIKY
jgi:Zn-dependent peptidase ImmA (M78 family)